MTDRHTPGPWTADISNAFIAVRARQNAEDYGGGAHVAVLGKFMAPGTDETHANARLIAAAPDLLAALEHIVRCNELGILAGKSYDDARAALAKARGE